MATKSRAARFLEDDGQVQDPDKLMPDPDASEMPADEEPEEPVDEPAEDEPAEDEPADATKVVEDMDHPDKMADMVGQMESHCEKYLDEDDDSCYTPGTDDDKSALSEAKMHLGMAKKHLSGRG
jgi:hypothetical protein